MTNAGKGLSHFRCCQHWKSAFDGTCSIIGPVTIGNSPFNRDVTSLHLCLGACPPTRCVDDQMLFQAVFSSLVISDANQSGAAVDSGAISCYVEAGHPRGPRARRRAQSFLSLPSEFLVPALDQQGAYSSSHDNSKAITVLAFTQR